MLVIFSTWFSAIQRTISPRAILACVPFILTFPSTISPKMQVTQDMGGCI